MAGDNSGDSSYSEKENVEPTLKNKITWYLVPHHKGNDAKNVAAADCMIGEEVVATNFEVSKKKSKLRLPKDIDELHSKKLRIGVLAERGAHDVGDIRRKKKQVLLEASCNDTAKCIVEPSIVVAATSPPLKHNKCGEFSSAPTVQASYCDSEENSYADLEAGDSEECWSGDSLSHYETWADGDFSHRNAAFRTTCSPAKFFGLVKQFTPLQKKTVVDMGFGAIMNINHQAMNRQFIKWLVMIYDLENDSLLLPNGLRVTVSLLDIGNILGIPYLGESIHQHSVTVNGMAPSWKKMIAAYEGIGSGEAFRIWFLHVACYLLLSPLSRCPDNHVLYAIISEHLYVSPSKYNWAEHVLINLREGIRRWRESKYALTINTSGCFFVLQALYLIKCKVCAAHGNLNFVSVNEVTNAKMFERLQFEMKQYGSYGVGVKPNMIPSALLKEPRDTQDGNQKDVLANASLASQKMLIESIDQKIEQCRTLRNYSKNVHLWIDDLMQQIQCDCKALVRLRDTNKEVVEASTDTISFRNLPHKFTSVQQSKLKKNQSNNVPLEAWQPITNASVAPLNGLASASPVTPEPFLLDRHEMLSDAAPGIAGCSSGVHGK